MSSKKEEERNEKIIRGLMKLPPNRRCINCNSLGPQYVCTNFWTFVCTTCSGIHREFTHRVKSVSMSKFTSQEVEALQRGGNQRARDIFFTEWDPQRYKLPNSSNVERIREFIKNVYVDRRYAVARSSDKPLRDMQGSKNQEEENRRASSYHSFSQSPPYEHQYEDRRYGKLPGALTRKGSDRGPYIGRLSTFVYSPSRFGGQIMFEDRFANEFPGSRVSEYSTAGTSDRFRDVKSTNFQRDLEFGSPSVQSGRDILGDGVQLQTDAKQDVDSIIRPQRNASSCSFCSFDNSSLSFKSLDAVGLMDTALDLDQSARPRSSVSASAAGQGPFQALFVQSLENSSAPYIDLFADATHLHPSTSSLEQNSSDVSISESKGWATFDLPQHISPTPTPVMSGDGVAQGNLSPSNNSLQLSSVQNSTTLGSFSSTANQWHGVAYGVQGPAGPTSSQLCNAFGDSTGSFNPASSENFLPNSELQGETQTLSASGNQDKNSRSLEESGKDGFRRSVADDLVAVPTLPVVGVTETFFPLPVLPPMGGMPSNAHDQKSINPFDLAYDSEMDSCSMFPDMGSLQAALPDAKMPAFLSGLNTSWFPQDPVLPFMPAVPQGGLTLFGAQGPTSQLPNLASQGSVAPLGGNPFA